MNAANQRNSTPKWSDVANDQDFQSADWETRQKVRGEFYRRVVEPETPAELREEVQGKFFTQTEPDVFGERDSSADSERFSYPGAAADQSALDERQQNETGLRASQQNNEEEAPGLASNALRNAGERGLDLAGNAVQFVGNMAEMGEKLITDHLGGLNPGVIGGESDAMRERGYEPDMELGGYGLDFTARAKPEDTDTGMTGAGQAVEDVGLGYQPNYTIDRALDNPSVETLAGAAAEQGSAALADIAALAINLPAYLSSRTQEIGESRAQNEGRDGMPEGGDYAVAGPTAAASVLLDRFALGRLLPGGKGAVSKASQVPGAVGRATATEAATEAVQEGGIEYAGESVGTEQGWDPVTAGRRAAGGAIVGGPTGGTVRAGTAAAEVAGGRANAADSEPEQTDGSPEEGASPSPETQQANEEAVGAAAELIRRPRFELSSSEREVRDSITYGDAFKSLRAAAEAQGDTEAVAELDAVSEEVSAALEAETMARTRGEDADLAPIRQRLDEASQRFTGVMERINGQQAESRQQDVQGMGLDMGAGQRRQEEWEQAWREQGMEDPSADLPNTTIEIERAAAETDTEPTPAQAEAGNSEAMGLTKVNKAAEDGVPAHSKLFPDGSRAETLRAQGFDSLDRDSQAVVLSHVVRSLDDPEVFRSVVESVPIDVMDILVGPEGSAKDLLHNPSMLAHRLAVPRDEPVPAPVARFIDSLSSSLEGNFAGRGAEESTLVGVGRPAMESGAAVGASSSGRLDTDSAAEVPAGLPSQLGGQPAKSGAAGAASQSDSGHVESSISAQGAQANSTSPASQSVSSPEGKLTPRRVPVERIEVDPEAYQFRTEVNAEGVDSRLEGVEEWDDLRAGNLLLHEREDGRIFAADGHHRVDLARRLQQPDVNAMVLREADGVSVEDARRLAAEANIAAGNAAATDAAKVFRNSEGEAEDVIAERNLPRRSQLVRDGADIARLGDDAFGAVLNRVVSEKDGAAIGRAFADPDQQLAAVDVFRRVQPQNENQRALLVNEVRQAGFAEDQGEQGGLFGDDPAESLIGERVRVMDRLRQELSRDRRLFATLNTHAQTAEAAGNRIATERNEQLSDTATQAISLLERATTTPEINQQINDAARRVSEGQSVADAARELKEVLLRGTGSEAAQPDRSPAPSGRPAETGGQVERGDQRAPAQDDARAASAGQQRPGRAEGQVTLKADGKPFQARRAVQLSKRFRDTPGAVAVEVDGGWGFMTPSEAGATGASIGRTEAPTTNRQDPRRDRVITRLQQRTRAALNDAEPGDIVTFAADTGYARGDTPYRLMEYTPNGEVRIENIETGGRTTLNQAEVEAVEVSTQRAAEQDVAEREQAAQQGVEGGAESNENGPIFEQYPEGFRYILRDPQAPRWQSEHGQAAADGEVGRIMGDERGDRLIIRNTGIQADYQGAGRATDAYADLADRAHRQGKILTSDVEVTLAAARIYERLEERGYQVTRSQTARLEDVEGESKWVTDRGPVFTVRPPVAETSQGDEGSQQNDAEGFTLDTQTEASLASRDREQQQAEQANAERRRQDEQRAAADREADDFALSGSSLPADQANARGQDPLFAFAGEGAQNADRHALENARSRIEAGDDAEVVRQETGWFRGPDNRWRFEIDDSDARFLPFVDGTAGQLWTEKLDRVLDHPKLFAAYPGLREVSVVSARGMPANRHGSYHHRRNEITLNAESNAMDQFSYLLHEVQHGIQHREGFATGGTPADYRLPPRQEQRLRDKIQELTRESGDFAREVLERYKAGEISTEEAQQQIQQRADEIGLNDLRQKLREGDARGAYRYYQRLYGETEARNVQARQGLTEAERADTPPSKTQDVPDSDVVVVYNGQEIASAPAPDNAEVSPESAPQAPRAEAIRARLSEHPELSGVEVVQSARELPTQVQLVMAMQGVEASDVSGVYNPDTGAPMIVADNLIDEADGVRKAVHEGVGHYGIRGMLGEELEPLMLEIYQSHTRSNSGRQNIEEIQQTYPFIDVATRKGKITLAEELVAHYIEGSNGRPKLGQRIMSTIRRLLRKLFPGIQWHTSDILAMGDKARQWLRRQQAARDVGDPRFAMAGDTASRRGFEPDENLQPESIVPVHDVEDQAKFESMRDTFARDDEYSGRPILVWKDESGANLAITGSHRLAAAEAAGTEVPVAFVKDGAGEFEDSKGMELSDLMGRGDEDLVRFLREFGDDRSARLMDAEVATNAVEDSLDARYSIAQRQADTSAQDLAAQLREEYPGLKLDMASRGQKATISRIVAPEREQGTGSAVMRRLTDWADASGRTMALTPSSDFGGSVKRLHEFYRRFGFVENKGRNKDYEISEAMYREPDHGVGDVRFSLTQQPGTVGGKYSSTDSTGFSMPDESLRNAALRKMADKMRPLKILEDAIRRTGRDIEEEADAYLAEELFHGKVEHDLRQLREQHVEPLAEGLAKANLSQAELDDYLYARHAPERNATTAERNPDNPEMQDGGSGMTNAQAAEIIERVANSGKQAEYDRLANIVYDMTRLRREAIRDGGLEDDAMIDAWEANWQYYVPLKGNASDDPGRPRTGRGFEVSGRESRIAGGRTSLAESPSSQVIVDVNESLIRRRKNEVAQSLLSLVTDNPNPALWEVFTDENPDTQRTPTRITDPETGQTRVEVQERPVNMAGNDRYFKAKRAGRTYYLKLHDERLMNAMRNVGPENNGVLIRAAGAVTRVMSSLVTSYNPEFMLTNFARDVQTALLNLSAEQTRDDGKIKGEAVVRQTARDIAPSMRAAWRGLRGKTGKNDGSREWDKWFREFQEDGAKTGYFDMKDLNAQAKEIQSMIRRADGTTLSHMLKARKKTADFVENMNGAVENAVRLSAYANARRAGVSRKKAASLAKNMTVNFNRRGEAGTALNAAYMFANASIQGTMNFARTMVTVKNAPEGKSQMNVWARMNMAQKLGLGMATGSFMLGMLNRWLSDEDEDGVLFYDKIPDYEKERNIILMTGWMGEDPEDYIKVPLPYGYNVFSVAGTHAESVTAGTEEPAEAAKNIVLAVAGSFSPIGFEDSDEAQSLFLKNLTPTIFRSITQVGVNENFAGSPIYREDFPFGTPTPDSSRSFRSTPEAYQGFAKFLNEFTGGTSNISGAIDVNPDVMQHLVNYYGGGAWGFVEKTADFAKRVATGEEVERYRVPFAGRFSGNVSEYGDMQRFYERRDELGQIANEADSLRGREKIDYRRDHQQQLRLFNRATNLEKQLTELRKRRDRIEETETLTDEAKKRRTEMVEKQMKRRIDDFNKRYNKIE